MKKNKKVALVEISDADISAVESLHDLLLEKHGYDVNSEELKKARMLTEKMYSFLYPENKLK